MAEHSGTYVSWLPGRFDQQSHTEVSQSLDLLCDPQTLVVVNARLLRLLVVGVILFLFPQIALERHQDELHAWAVLCDLADPLRFYVLERVGGVHGEAEHDRVGVIVAE
jgi:hypothetical protein